MFESGRLNEINVLIMEIISMLFSFLRLYFNLILTYLNDTYYSIYDRLMIEFSDAKTIIFSIINSTSDIGKLLIGLVFLIITLIFLFSFLGNKKNLKNKDSKLNSSSHDITPPPFKAKRETQREKLMEMEIQLLELQDKFNRNIISHTNYLNENRRISKKVELIN